MLRASWSPCCKISLTWPSFRTGAHATVPSRIVRGAWSSAVVTDLKTKVQKYETKAAQGEERVRQATDGPSGPSMRCLLITMASWQRTSGKSSQSGRLRSWRSRDSLEGPFQSAASCSASRPEAGSISSSIRSTFGLKTPPDGITGGVFPTDRSAPARGAYLRDGNVGFRHRRGNV
jgi:hypothetical protein